MNWENVVPYVLLVLAVFVVMSPLIFNRGFSAGCDSYFHMNQVYEDAMQIKHLNFSYFTSIYGFDATGRMVNAVYAPLTHYLFGSLLLLCGTWFRFEMVMDLLLLSVGAIGVYKVSRKLYVPKVYSYMIAVIYLTTPPVQNWVGNYEFNDLGALLLPYAMLLAINIARIHDIRPIRLALLVTLIIQIHFLTAFNTCIMLSVATLIAFCATHRKLRLIKHLAISAGLAILLNLNIIGGLLQLKRQQVIPTFPGGHLQKNSFHIRHYGFDKIGAVTSFFLLLIIAYFVLDSLYSTWSKQYRTNYGVMLTTIIAVLFFALSSAYFPWDKLATRFPIIRTCIQFTMRFNPLFFLSSLCLAGVFATRIARIIPAFLTSRTARDYISPWVGVLAILLLCLGFEPLFHEASNYYHWLPVSFYRNYQVKRDYVVRYLNDQHYLVKNPYRLRGAFLNGDTNAPLRYVPKTITDYLPTTLQFNAKNYYKIHALQDTWKQLQHSKLKVHRQAIPNGVVMTWQGHGKDTIPYVGYRGTQVSLNGNLTNYKITKVGAIKLHDNHGPNRAVITYHPGATWYILILVMLLSWAGLFIYLAKHKQHYNY